MIKKYKIIYDREGCTKFGGCAAASKHFDIARDKKADLVGGKKNKEGLWELEISEEDYAKNKDAAEICPAKVIHIIDLETGEEII
ncbi:ferredoxin [Candidatus Pacearchaeota archaeon]|nr:ferredoxin [Candidatus Pacearchaeota archaeon]